MSRFTASAQPLHHRCVQCRQLVVLLQLQVHRGSLRVDEPIRGGGAFVCEQGLGLRHGPHAVVHGKRSAEFLVLVVLTTVHPHVNRQWRGWQWLAITVRNHTMFGEPGLAAGCGGSGVGGAGVGGNGATEPQVDPSLCCMLPLSVLRWQFGLLPGFGTSASHHSHAVHVAAEAHVAQHAVALTSWVRLKAEKVHDVSVRMDMVHFSALAALAATRAATTNSMTCALVSHRWGLRAAAGGTYIHYRRQCAAYRFYCTAMRPRSAAPPHHSSS